MPRLDFKGRSVVWNHHLAVPYRELIPRADKSLTDKVSLHDNLIIHGDNLHALKALLPTYAGKVKCIYIDPPYNTGNKDWNYRDDLKSPITQQWLKETIDNEDPDRHEKWLCMMTPRLKVLKELLAETGIIMVSIDDSELNSLIELMDEIYGEKRRIGIVCWFKKRKGSYLSKEFVSLTEYVLIYRKTDELLNLYGGSASESESQPLVKRGSRIKELILPHQQIFTKLPSGTYGKGPYGRGSTSINLTHDVKVSNGHFLDDVHIEGPFTWSQEMLDSEIEKGASLTINTKNFQPRAFRKYESDQSKGFPSFIDGRTDSATSDDAYETLQQIFKQDRPFPYSKPHALIEYLTESICKNTANAIILDSFAGSGTTAHAVLALNKVDGGNRKFILVECEDYADSITAERVRRVIKGVPAAKDPNLKAGLGGTFSYFDLGDPIEIGTLLKGEKLPAFEELARYVFFTAVGEEIDLAKVNQESGYIGSAREYDIYMLYRPDVEYLRSTALTHDFAKGLPPHAGRTRVVFAPARYLSREFMDEFRVEFCQLPYELYRGLK